MKKIKITFEFPPNSIKQPLTYRLIKDFDLMLNILSADVSLNRTGRLTMDMQGRRHVGSRIGLGKTRHFL